MLWNDDASEGLTVEQLPQPWQQLVAWLQAHSDHPACAWFEMIGNGVVEDDCLKGLPLVPTPVYRFRRGERVAYIWPEGEGWVVEPWRRRRTRVRGRAERVDAFRDALDVLTRKRRWWQFWG
jgi:hypothetical protein